MIIEIIITIYSIYIIRIIIYNSLYTYYYDAK